jgi:hypothetical protein
MRFEQPGARASAIPEATDPSSEVPVVWTAGRIATTASLAVVGGVTMVLGISAASAHADAVNRIQNDNAQLGSSSSACSGGANPTCADLSDALSSRDGAATREAVFFTIGGVALAGAIGTTIAWYLMPVQSARGGVLVPTVTRTGAGVSWSGSF